MDANSPDKRKSEKVQNGFEKTSTESIDNCSIKAIKKDPLGFSTTSTSQSKNEICEADANILQTNTNSNSSQMLLIRYPCRILLINHARKSQTKGKRN